MPRELSMNFCTARSSVPQASLKRSTPASSSAAK
jgi:hypothetical protein